MRKFLKDYSFIGVVLVISVFGLGGLFRVLNIESVSAWGDEVASLYYAQHLDRVFLYESHTPFYYLICKLWMGVFPDTIVSLRYLFISLSFLLTALSSFILSKRRGSGAALIFFILWWLWPTDVIFSRQARHYSLYAEMTFLLLILWDSRSYYARKWLLVLWSLFQFIHPFTLLPVWFLSFYDFVKKKSDRKELLCFLSTSLPLMLYYGVRFLFQGREKVLSNISWVSENFPTFQKSLLLLFMGDSIPLTKIFPLSLPYGLLMLLLVGACFLFRKDFFHHFKQNEKMLKFFQLYLMTILFVEIFSFFVTNVRTSRYYIFLVPFFIFALLDWIIENNPKRNLKLATFLALVLIGYNFFVLRPWRNYAWDDQNVAEFKSYLKLLPPRELVVCANAFQLDYYFQRPYKTCTDVALRLHLNKQSFYLFDLTGNDKLLMLFLLNSGHIDKFHKFNQAVFISVSYPDSK